MGYAQSPIVKRFDRPLGAVTVEVARQAIADAGLDVADVDGFTTSTLLPAAGDHSAVDGVTSVSANWLAAHLGVDPGYATGFQGYGQLPGAVALAVNALVSGAADHVLVHRALHNPPGRYHDSSRLEAPGSAQWTMPQGFFGPLAMIGLAANEYAQRFGATRESLGAVVVEARKNGARLPWSYWHDRPLDLDEYLASPLIADPVCRFDCDLPVDGVAAFVLTTAERARDLPNRPVYVAGYANGTARPATACRCTGRSTTSSRSVPPRRVASGNERGSVRGRSICPRSTTGSRRSSGSGSRRWASARPGPRTSSCGRRHRQRCAGCTARAVGWRRPRYGPSARRPADAGVLPATRGARR